MAEAAVSRSLKIKKYSDINKKVLEDYVASYECYVDDTLLFRLDYQAKLNMSKSCSIVDHKNNPILEMRPVKGIGRDKISFIKQEKFLVKKIGDALVDAKGNNVALIIDPMSVGKAILRNAMGGDADGFVICTPDKNLPLANINTIKRKHRLPWPFCIAENLVQLFRRPLDNFIYQIENIDDRFAPELLFGLSVLLMQKHNTV